MDIRRLDSTDELFALAGGDSIVLTNLSPGAPGAAWRAGDGTFAFGGARACGGDPDLLDWLLVIGDPDTAGVLARHVLDGLPQPPRGISVPRATDLSSFRLAEAEDDWDFMLWEHASGPMPVQPGEERVVEVLPGEPAETEIAEFLKVANPTHSTKPGSKDVTVWGVIRDESGELVASGALCRRRGGNGFLASIGSLPAARGQGLGAAITGWLTRRSAAEGDAVCALGHWHPNEPARRLYLRLGYRTTHEMHGGRLPL